MRYLVAITLGALVGFGVSTYLNIRGLNHRLERLEKVHQIFEDGSVCHIDPDGPTYCAR